MTAGDISDIIIDASEYGIGPRWHLGAKTPRAVAAVLDCPDHLVGFARAEIRDQLGTHVDIITRSAR